MKDVFISYKAEEFEEASWVKSVLEQNGISCWMAPMCIPGGSSYAVEIPQAIRASKAFVLVLSTKSQESRWVSREVDMAINEGKVVLPFMLENCDLKDDFNFYLTNVQRYSAYENKVAAMEKMLRELKVLIGHSEQKDADGVTDSAYVETIENSTTGRFSASLAESENDVSGKETVAAPKRSFKLIAIITAAIIIVLLVVILIIAVLNDDKEKINGDNHGNNSITTTPVVDSENFEMSDNLFDFTFEMFGEVYKLPCSYDKFIKNGWTISSTGTNSDSLIPGNKYETVSMSKDGSRIVAYIYNFSGNAKKISECKIGGIECEKGDISDFTIAKNVSVDFTPELIETAFGTPNDLNSGEGYKSMRYINSGSDDSYVKFYYSTDGKYSVITLRNFVKTDSDKTETNTERPEYLSKYIAPQSLGSDIFASVINVEGDLYSIPCPVSEFINKGWSIVQKPGSVVAGGSDYIVIQKADKKMNISICNFAEYQTIVENCVAYKISADDYNKVAVKLPCGDSGISIGMKKADLENVLSDKFEFYEGSSSYSYSYYEYDDRDFSISIYVDKVNEVVSDISISCK